MDNSGNITINQLEEVYSNREGLLAQIARLERENYELRSENDRLKNQQKYYVDYPTYTENPDSSNKDYRYEQ